MTRLSSFFRRFFANEWTPGSTIMPHGPRAEFAYATLDDDRHFVIGGVSNSTSDCSDVLEYNSTRKKFTTHTLLPQPRNRCTATAIDDHRLLVVAGWDGSALRSCLVYDTRTREWSQDWPELNIGRQFASCVATNNKVYVIGGRNADVNAVNDNSGETLNSVEELDLSLPSPRWRILPQRLQTARQGCGAVVDPKNPNNILVVGGCNDEDRYLTSCEVFSLQQEQDEQTRTIPELSTARMYHSMVVVQNRFLVVVGGWESYDECLSSVEFLDLEEPTQEQQWHSLPSMRNAREFLAAFVSSRNRTIVVAGGWGVDDRIHDTMEELRVKCMVRRASQQAHEGHQQDGDGDRPALAKRPRLKQPRTTPPLSKLPSGCLDAIHQTKIQRWLIEREDQMTAFVAQIDAREKELAFEGDKNHRARNDYVAQVNSTLEHARALLDYMQDTSRMSDETNGPATSPPSMSECPLDETQRRRMEAWIDENEKRRNEFVAAAETRERELVREMEENRRGCDEYVGQVRMQMRKARAIVGADGVPPELVCPITHELMVDPVISVDGQTYERAAIERVFGETREGKKVRSPVTGSLLSSRSLIPNVSIRSQCVEYADENRK